MSQDETKLAARYLLELALEIDGRKAKGDALYRNRYPFVYVGGGKSAMTEFLTRSLHRGDTVDPVEWVERCVATLGGNLADVLEDARAFFARRNPPPAIDESLLEF